MRTVNLTVAFNISVDIDNDSSKHVQDVAVRKFIEEDLIWSLETLESEGMEITEITDVTFE